MSRGGEENEVIPKKSTKPTRSEAGSNPLDEAQKLVKQVAAIVGETPSLTAKGRTRSVKLRKGGEAVIPTVAAVERKWT